MNEPCIACRHNEVLALNEPCFSCISFVDTNVRSYTKFEAVPGKVVEVADGQQIPGLSPGEGGATIPTISFRRRPHDDQVRKMDAAIEREILQLMQPSKLENAARNHAKDQRLFNVDGYESLADVLERAYEQAAAGKGAERHGQGQPFDEQPMQQLIRLYGIGFALGQAAKKAQEAQRLPTVERQVAELLGAINYLAGAVVALERGNG